MYFGWHTPSTGFASSTRTPPPVLASERLMKGWEATGSFWRPETPDQTYWGTITFSPGAQTTIVLEGNLFGAGASRPPLDVSSLNGRLFNGALCSIFSCWGEVESYAVGRQDFPRTRVFSHLSIIGGHWDTADACQFESLQIRFSHLDQWFGPPYDIQPIGDNLTEMLLSFKPPELNADFIFQEVNVDLKSFCSYSIPSIAAPEGAKWPYQYYLILWPENHQNVDWFCDLTSMLRELFVFLIGSGVYTLDIVGSYGSIEDNSIRMFQVDCPAAIPSVVRPELRYFSTRHHDYNDVLPSIIRAWFERHVDLEIAAEAYTELLCNDGTSKENILLRTVQTLEHLHGILWQEESRYVKKATLKRFIKWLRTNFPESLEYVPPDEMQRLVSQQEIILSRIGGINNLSFRSRLEKIFREIPGGTLMPILDNPRNANEFLDNFLERLEATRHYLTHFDEKQRKSALQGEEIDEAALICWAALTFWIGRELGIDEIRAGDMALAAKEAMFLVHSRNRL